MIRRSSGDPMKHYFGSCVDNPFDTVNDLCEIIDEAEEITREQFLYECEVDTEIELGMYKFPNDYTYYRNGTIYFFAHSCIEHFFR